MKNILMLVISFLLLSCRNTPVIIASPEVSRTAYAIKDSFDNARIDLADGYSSHLVQLVTPPKDSIVISPIIRDGKRVAIIPDKYRNDNVVVVGTTEWNNLLTIKDVVVQLANDKTNLNAELLRIHEEVRQQQEVKEKLAADNINLTKELKEYKNALLKRTLYLIGLIGAIGGYVYLKIKGIGIPFLPL